MSDAYELLEAGSTVTGDTWTMLNNLGGGSGVGQVVAELEGTVMDKIEITGVILSNKIIGEITVDNINGAITRNDIIVEIEEDNIRGNI